MKTICRSRFAGPEVLYASEPIVTVGRSEVEHLKELAATSPRGRIRLCMHPSTDHPLHEMLIVHPKGAYVRPHKHSHKAEAVLVLEGQVDVIVFQDDGSIRKATRLDRAGETFYHRINESSYHTLIIQSEMLVFHEITSGPFVRTDTIFAPWSPEEEEIEIARYMDNLQRQTELLWSSDGRPI
ncbi:MAG: WbuC family cupin fold metalloprotein [Sedimentisphaerales bacterium]|nr:WbuC family cupin fold metalloprotein [Sedimentisphaerales bacterium]